MRDCKETALHGSCLAQIEPLARSFREMMGIGAKLGTKSQQKFPTKNKFRNIVIVDAVVVQFLVPLPTSRIIAVPARSPLHSCSLIPTTRPFFFVYITTFFPLLFCDLLLCLPHLVGNNNCSLLWMHMNRPSASTLPSQG